MPLTLDTTITNLHRHDVAKLSVAMSRKLAVALAQPAGKSNVDDVTVEDLLNYFPTRYEDRSNFLQIDQLEDGMEAAVELYVRTASGVQVGRNRERWKPQLYLFEITGGDIDRRLRPVTVKWFVSGKNAAAIVNWHRDRFTRGTRLVAYGRWEEDDRGNFFLKVAKPEEIEIIQSVQSALSPDPDKTPSETNASAAERQRPAIAGGTGSQDADENTTDPALATIHTGRVPVYRKLGPFQTKRLREIVHSVISALDVTAIPDDMPAELIERNKLIPRGRALTELHFPPEGTTIADYEMFRSPAQRRLIFDEFFWLSFAMQLLRGERQKEPKGTVIEISDVTKARLNNMLPFELTNAQKKVTGEIFDDLKSDSPMNRLIQGDVGSGKTIVAFLAIFAAMENGYQAALMAPTEILAEQHFRNASRTFADTGYRVALLIGSTKAAEKRKIYAALAAGEINLIIGTHAIIQEGVEFDRLGLAVIDEQHRFGVMQRAQIKAAGRNPDILVMTATPIPRSLAMTVYGDLDVSIINELPPGRTPIKTVVCGEDKRQGVYKGIEREVDRGRQAYVVYPLVEESEKMDLKAAKQMYDDLNARIFPHLRVGLLHGKMRSAEKDAVMQDFVSGDLDILVSTTVIEVGVDVPNASLMVIEHAERFGLSQLHQLRGRVGRGAEQSFCVLLAGYKRTAVAKERLGIMEQTSDGFKIAEKDLELRGQGEILGTRQSGIQSFRLANIVRDLDILAAARNEAEEYLVNRRLSPETSAMVKRARSDKNVAFGSIA
ncbi:MAG: ATP-dependent DNA helicase RecG [Pyrinomonadaceae bacterium]